MSDHHILIMGSINNNAAIIYLTITDGKICRKVTSPTTTSRERVNKMGKVIHEEFFKGWAGKITNIETRESDYGKDWNITIEDADSTALLQFKYSSGYASSFLKALPNVDLGLDVEIIPKLTIDGEKKRGSIILSQNGKGVKWFYTKDTPNGIPSMQKIKIKGVEQWDDSEMMEFLEEMVKAKFIANTEMPF
jgi:hypothetical protein